MGGPQYRKINWDDRLTELIAEYQARNLQAEQQAQARQSQSVIAYPDNRGETYEQDKAWSNRIEHGACSRLHDRTTDSLDDEAECDNDYAAQPLCVSYEGFALGWYDMASDPNPTVSSPANAMAALDAMRTKKSASEPPYSQSPGYIAMLRRLLNAAYSAARAKAGTRYQFAGYAYKACMEGHPL